MCLSATTLSIFLKISFLLFQMEKEILKILKCQICGEIPAEEIFQCRNGHSICKQCKNLVSKCGLCKEPFDILAVRNRVAEDLLDVLTFDCKNISQGCDFRGTRKDLTSHYEICAYSEDILPLDGTSNLSTFENVEATEENSYPDQSIVLGTSEDGTVTCHGCHNIIEGNRSKCLQCPDYNLCEQCSRTGTHAMHIFALVKNEEQAAWLERFLMRPTGWRPYLSISQRSAEFVLSSLMCCECPNTNDYICLQCRPLCEYCENCFEQHAGGHPQEHVFAVVNTGDQLWYFLEHLQIYN